jgi:hypothetical protein
MESDGRPLLGSGGAATRIRWAAVNAPVTEAVPVLRVYRTPPCSAAPKHGKSRGISNGCHLIDGANNDRRQEPVDLVIGNINQ